MSEATLEYWYLSSQYAICRYGSNFIYARRLGGAKRRFDVKTKGFTCKTNTDYRTRL